MPTIQAKKFNTAKIGVASEWGKLRTGMKILNLDYSGSSLRLQTPWMKMPFDPDEHENERWSICLNCEDNDFGSAMKSLDEKIISIARSRSREFFKKQEVSDEFIQINYSPVLRTGGEYSDKYKCKADRNTNVFTDQGERSDVSKLRKGDEMRIIAELRYIWVNNGKFGATWVAKQIQFRSNSMDEMEFHDDKFGSDDSDDEDDDSVKMSDITGTGMPDI